MDKDCSKVAGYFFRQSLETEVFRIVGYCTYIKRDLSTPFISLSRLSPGDCFNIKSIQSVKLHLHHGQLLKRKAVRSMVSSKPSTNSPHLKEKESVLTKLIYHEQWLSFVLYKGIYPEKSTSPITNPCQPFFQISLQVL